MKELCLTQEEAWLIAAGLVAGTFFGTLLFLYLLSAFDKMIRRMFQ